MRPRERRDGLRARARRAVLRSLRRDRLGQPAESGVRLGGHGRRLLRRHPLFFPIDDVTTTERRFEAKVPPQYGYNWEFEDQAFPVDGVTHTGDNSGAANHAGAIVHNFYFSTEVVYWFKFDPITAARLDFTGDDDVWVFVNGHLAVDLGGVHQPVDGSVTIDATTADTYELEEGKVYAITIFQAERRIEARASVSRSRASRRTAASACRCAETASSAWASSATTASTTVATVSAPNIASSASTAATASSRKAKTATTATRSTATLADRLAASWS